MRDLETPWREKGSLQRVPVNRKYGVLGNMDSGGPRKSDNLVVRHYYWFISLATD